MGLPIPGSLTPSKVATFKDCGLAFRFSVIDRLPEPPSLQAFKGTVVHRALELLMWEEPRGARTVEAALTKLDRAFAELSAGPEGIALGLEAGEREEFLEDSRQLVRNYFVLEDPDSVRVIGTELLMQVDIGLRPVHEEELAHVRGAPEGLATAVPPATHAGTVRLRGIIDRLELDDDGELVVTDYKTGRAPGAAQEQARLGGVHFYAFLCERVLGKRPVRVQLFHLREPLAIETAPSDMSISGLEIQATAIWDAIRRACFLEDFRPKPGAACDRCAFHAYCPAKGGDISLVRGARDGHGLDGIKLPLPAESPGRDGATPVIGPEPLPLPLASSW
jgi:putative RecB family exonuclease